eukprot:8822483-Alexandrium_andersonii.AAC.1
MAERALRRSVHHSSSDQGAFEVGAPGLPGGIGMGKGQRLELGGRPFQSRQYSFRAAERAA